VVSSTLAPIKYFISICFQICNLYRRYAAVTSNDAYRLGNAVERQGVGWIGARRLVLEDEGAYKDSILFNFLMGESEEQRAFVGCVVAHKRRLERNGIEPHVLHGDNNTIVIPLRLSDKAGLAQVESS
jgi:hypothetical protein